MKPPRRISRCFRNSTLSTVDTGGDERRILRFGLAAALVLVLASPLISYAQFGPLVSRLQAPQAHSQEELDDCLAIVTDSDPRETIAEAQRFSIKYPKSELLGTVFEYQMLAFARVHDLDGEMQAGERALRLQHNNVATLLTLATDIAENVAGRPDTTLILQRGAEYAQSALQEISTLRIPKEIPPARWEATKSELEGQAHEALGQVAARRGQPEAAIKEFEAAVQNNQSAKGSTFYRMGAAYSMLGKKELAATAFRRAVELGPDPVRDSAQKALRTLGVEDK